MLAVKSMTLNFPKMSSSEEKIVFMTLCLSYVFYLTGLLYIVGSVVGWCLFFILLLRWFVEGRFKETACVPVTIWIWVLGMMLMLLALLIGHSNYDLGMGQTIKSSIGWAKGWALLALFPLLGALIHINPALIVRGCCILASQSILFFILGALGVIVGFNGPLYLSPAILIGGPESAFEVNLYGMNPETGKARWSFFAPWAPAAGLMSCLYLIICSQEKNRFWKRAGVLGAFVMCLFCQSRAGWAIFLGLIPLLFFIKHVANPIFILISGLALSTLVLLGQPAIEGALDVHQQVKDSRADSTRVREALATIAVQRWESEAPIWGHGIVERGPKMVEHMPIGSHHSWYGLLFVKGIVGFLALAIPLGITLIYLLVASVKDSSVHAALLILLVISGYSFFENLEVLAYLYWPALLWLGISLNPLKSSQITRSAEGVTV
jgi:O-Antigen ligase